MAHVDAPPRPLRSVPRITSSQAVGTLFAAWAAVKATEPLGDNSFLTHLATGRLMLDSGIPRVDPYSFTAQGEPWVVQSWLVSGVLAISERAFGAGGVRSVILVVAVALIVGLWALTKNAGSLPARLVLCAPAVGAAGGAWSMQRPLAVGLVGLVLVLLVLDRRVPPWVLLPTMWIWVNSHGSFPVAAVIVVAVGIGRIADRVAWRHERNVLGWVLGGTLAGAISPLGLRLLTFPMDFLSRWELLRHVDEGQPPQLDLAWTRSYLVLLAVAVIALARRFSWARAIPMLVVVPLSLLAARNVSIGVLVVTAMAAPGLEGFGSIPANRRSLATTAAGTMLAISVLLVGVGRIGSEDAPVDLGHYADDALAALDRVGAIGDGGATNLANDLPTGNLMTFLGTDEPVLYDDRFDMYPMEVSFDYLTLHYGSDGWSEVLDKYEIEFVVWGRAQPLDQLLSASEDWRLLWSDDGHRVFCRRQSSAAC